jgi:hypothetical protein
MGFYEPFVRRVKREINPLNGRSSSLLEKKTAKRRKILKTFSQIANALSVRV